MPVPPPDVYSTPIHTDTTFRFALYITVHLYMLVVPSKPYKTFGQTDLFMRNLTVSLYNKCIPTKPNKKGKLYKLQTNLKETETCLDKHTT